MRNSLFIVGLLAAFCLAASPEPQSKPARTALDRYAAARAKIDSEYQAKLANLNRNLAADLQGALKAATKSGNLEEANWASGLSIWPRRPIATRAGAD